MSGKAAKGEHVGRGQADRLEPATSVRNGRVAEGQRSSQGAPPLQSCKTCQREQLKFALDDGECYYCRGNAPWMTRTGGFGE